MVWSSLINRLMVIGQCAVCIRASIGENLFISVMNGQNGGPQLHCRLLVREVGLFIGYGSGLGGEKSWEGGGALDG